MRWSTGIASAAVAALVIAFAVHVGAWSQDDIRNGAPAQTYATGPGERRSVTFSDGTRVVLAPNSQLSLSSSRVRSFSFSHAANRTAVLTGEALFTVKDASNAPFVVRTGHVTTRVLGTTFTVRHDSARDVQVIVQSGKVMVQGRATPVTVATGQVVRVTDSTTTVSTLEELDQYTDLAKGQMTFRYTPVQKILAAVERWYGYQFRLADSSITRSPLTVTLDVGNRQETLADIAAMLDVSMTMEGNVVTLHARRHTPSRPVSPRRDTFTPATEMGR